MNNRISVQRLNSLGLLNQRADILKSDGPGTDWNQLSIIKHQMWLIEQEFIKR